MIYVVMANIVYMKVNGLTNYNTDGFNERSIYINNAVDLKKLKEKPSEMRVNIDFHKSTSDGEYINVNTSSNKNVENVSNGSISDNKLLRDAKINTPTSNSLNTRINDILNKNRSSL